MSSAFGAAFFLVRSVGFGPEFKTGFRAADTAVFEGDFVDVTLAEAAERAAATRAADDVTGAGFLIGAALAAGIGADFVTAGRGAAGFAGAGLGAAVTGAFFGEAAAAPVVWRRVKR